MKYYIIVFKNTHDAMSGERKLKELNFNFRIMPTPTVITQSCGICIRIEDEVQINTILDGNVIEFKGIYTKDENGYTAIS